MATRPIWLLLLAYTEALKLNPFSSSPKTPPTRVAVLGGGSPAAVIESIRQDKLLDAEIPEEMSGAVAELRDMCGRALEKLAKDLCKRSHSLRVCFPKPQTGAAQTPRRSTSSTS